MMNFQEMVIAFKRNLKITFIIFNNGIYGSIRMHQEFKYPGKTIATSLNNPEFVSLSKSFGIKAINIKDPQHLFKNYNKLRNNFDGPILLNMNTDPEIINPQKTIDELAN
jgi:acetolactate synthase-1/2/3 large subunit